MRSAGSWVRIATEGIVVAGTLLVGLGSETGNYYFKNMEVGGNEKLGLHGADKVGFQRVEGC